MAEITHAGLALARRQWVRTLIDTYAFGMYTVMVIMTLYHLLKRGNAWSAHRVVLVYTIFMFCVTVGWYYSQTRIDEAQTIEFLAGPSVSSEISVGDSCSALDNITDVLSIIQFWGNDVLMLYRAKMIFPNHRIVMVAPVAIFLAFAGISLALLATCDPRVVIPNSLSVVVAMYSLSALLNVLVTGMIAVKLLLHRRSMVSSHVRSLVSHDVYISAVGVLAESAALYSASLIVFVSLRATGNLSYKWFEGVMMAMSFLSQAWIILRISMGTTYIRTNPGKSITANSSAPLAPHHLRRSTLITSHADSTFAYKSQSDNEIALNAFNMKHSAV